MISSRGRRAGGAHRRTTTLDRRVRALTVGGLVAALLVLVPTQTAVAAPAVNLAKDGDSTVLVGGTGHFTLTATNPGDTDQYNTTFRDELPVGVTYQASSTSPASAGEPTVVVDPVDHHQTLIWRNTADLPVGAKQTLGFSVAIDPAVYPVGSSFVNVADLYTNADPRVVAKFDAAGDVRPGSFSAAGSSNPFQVTITALKLTKDEGSPEHELLRGIHDQTTVYTLKVTNNDTTATNSVTLVDYLPAQLEFLGCGNVDNGPLEYTGAASLTATPTVTPCVVPDTVETVSNPPGRPAGVYTKVTWTLPDLAGGATATVKYRAGIPQRANTTTFAGGTPTPGSRLQAANLANNTGADTRETLTEQSLTNSATVAGSYTGTTTSGLPAVSDTASQTVTAEDVSLQKSASTGSFSSGNVVTYTLTVRGSEYVDATNVVVTDHLPNGLCPLSSTTAYDASTGCGAAAGQDPAGTAGASYSNVVANPDGTFDLTFTPVALTHDQARTITFKARMKAAYVGGDPTVSGDTFVNTTALTGTTGTLATNPPTAGSAGVKDDSSHTLTSDGPSLDKTIKANTASYDCADGPYVDPASDTDPTVIFSKGSRVCFRIRVEFSTTNRTKNPVLTDFLPDGVAYEAGSAVVTTGPGTVGGVLDPSDLVWRIGDVTGANRFAPAGSFFEVTLAGLVTQPADGPAPDVTGNLAKLRWTNTSGQVSSLRDQVPFSIAPVPPVGIVKAASRLVGGPGYPTGALADGDAVVAGNQLRYTVTVTNNGSAPEHSDRDVVGPDVWDVLPAGIRCADVSAISDGGACTDPGAPGHPAFTGNGAASAIRWNLPDSVVLAPAASKALTYDVLVPASVSVGVSYVNVTAVASYGAPTNVGTIAQHRPENNIDTGVTADQVDAPAARDDFTVITPKSGVAKSNTTGISETGNSQAGQATIGESVTYTVAVTVPAHTTVYDGVLSDPAPTGITFTGGPVVTFSDGNGGTTLPAGTTSAQTATLATLTLPTTYANTSDFAHVFTLTLTGRVTTLAGNTNGTVRANTATLTSNGSAGGTAIPARSASSSLTVVEPSPSLTKTDDVPGTVAGGQTLTFTLKAGNAAGRPTLHDAFVVDCVPAMLAFTGFTTVPVGTTATTAAGGAGNSCAAGTTAITWNAGDLVAGTANDKSLVYTTTVASVAVGGVSFTNSATLSGSSLDDNDTQPAQVGTNERGYAVTKADTNTVTKATLSKSTSTPTRTIGELAQYTVTVTVPKDVTLYDSLVYDVLPAGLDASTLTTTTTTCAPACSLTATPVTSTAGTAGARNIGWTLGDVAAAPAARTVTISYTAKVADVGGNVSGTTLLNAAKLLWNVVDGTNPTTASSTGFTQTTSVASTTVTVTEPVLTLTKGVDDTTPEPGQTIHYTVSVANPAGSNRSPAYNVVVKDVVPVGLTGITTISNGGTYDASTRTITWTLAGPLASPGSVALTYNAKLTSPPPSGPLKNTATVTGYDGLASGGRHYTGPSAQVTVTPVLPHVRVGKTIIGGATAYIGQSKTWQIVVTSDGDAPAYGVDVKDVLPPSWTYDAGSAQVSVAGGANQQVEPSTSGQTLTWTDLGNLPTKGQTVVVVFSATPGSGVTTSPGVGMSVDHTNTASTTVEDAEGSQADASGNRYNSGPSTAVARIASADVRVVKAHAAAPVAGQPFSWTLTVSNAGPDTAVGPFVVGDTLPAALSGAGVTASGNGWTCSVASGPGTISCSRSNAADTLANGAAFPVITVTAQLPADLVASSTLLNSATVSAQTQDPVPGNNTDTDSAVVQTKADLDVVKTLTSSMVAGYDATYQLVVSNAGPSVHRGLITVADAVPAGTTYVSATGSGWSCGEASGTITCTRSDERPVGALPTITVTLHVDAGRTAAVVNTATVTGTTTDPDPGNNTDTVTTTPGTSADLEIAKHSEGNTLADPWANGEAHSYLLTVTNHGPSVAQAPVKITDTLPTGMTYTGFESVDGTWSCASTTLVTCTLTGTLAPGATVKVRVKIQIGAATAGPYENTAHVSSTTTDPVPANNDDTDRTDTVDRTDFSLSKSHPSGPVHAGEQLTFSLVATNHGPTKATATTSVTDTLPAGMTFVSGSETGTGWSCAGAAGNKVVCTSEQDVDPGDDLPTLGFTVTIAADAGPATLTNSAVVSADADKNPANNSATDPVAVTDLAKIVLVKTTTGADPVHAGDSTSYDVTVTNDGPSDADDLVVTEQPPAGLKVTAISGTGWDCTLATLVCTRSSLADGASASITVTATVSSGTPTGSTLTNVADVSTSTSLAPGSDTEDDADVDVDSAADLSLVKTHPTGTAVAGVVTTYGITVHNAGPSDAVGPIKVTDTLPTDFSFVSADNGWTCDDSASPEIVCTLAGPLLAGADAPVLTMSVQVAGNASLGTHTNEAAVSSATPDPDKSNNEDDADVDVERIADVSVVKSHTGAAAIGGQVSFTLQASNDGPSSARDVVVTDPLPAGLTYVSADGGTEWTCSGTGGTVTCDHVGPLAGGTDAAPITVVVAVGAAAYPGVDNVATISTATPDDNPKNDSSTDTLPVPPVADLSVVKTAVGEFVVGKEARYDLRVRNDGPTEAPGLVTVSDTLPAGLEFVSGGAGSGWGCSAVGQAVSCMRIGLAAGADVVVGLVVRVLPAAYPAVVNTASVSSGATDPDPGDNSSTVTTPVTPTVVLRVVKTLESQVGDQATWRIGVTNDGPSDTIAPVTITDLLPATLTYVSATGDGFTCGDTGQLVTCTYPALVPAGETIAVEFVTTVHAAPGQAVTNEASATGGTAVSPPSDVDTAVVTVPDPDETTPGDGDVDGTGSGLPDTGGPRMLLVPLGLLLLVLGGAGVRVGRRRTS